MPKDSQSVFTKEWRSLIEESLPNARSEVRGVRWRELGRIRELRVEVRAETIVGVQLERD